MALPVVSPPSKAISSNPAPVVHVRSNAVAPYARPSVLMGYEFEGIEVKFTAGRSKYPVSIKATFGDDESDKSKQYGSREIVHWLLERQFETGSQFRVHIREHRSLRRIINITTVCISVSDLVVNPFFEAKNSEGDVSLKIHSNSDGKFMEVIRRLVHQSQVQLEAMKVFLEKLGRACETLDYVVTITDVVSSVHPAAESAARWAIALLQLCQKLTECHTSACELMEDVAAFLSFADIPERGLKCKVTAQTTEEMLVLFESICRTIIKYSNGSILGGLLDDRIDEIYSFKEKFRRLKETFGWCLTTETWKTILRIEENTNALLLQNLNPLTKACYNENKLCFEGSRRDTLQVVEKWSESESSPKVFWLYGSAGLGKTAIAHTVAKLFHEQNRLAGSFLPTKRQSSDRIMPTIAYHLAGWHADYQEYILDVLRGPRKAGIFSGLGGQFDLLVKRPILEIGIHSPPVHKPLIIVLDALESCYDTGDCRRSFVNYIFDIATLVPWLKVFVTSRSSEAIERHFYHADVEHLALDDPMLDLYHDTVAYAKLCAERRDSLEKWTPGMKNDFHCFSRRIRRLFNASSTIRNTKILGPAVDACDTEDLFGVLIQIVMDREGMHENDVPVVRGILAIMACVASFESPTKESLSDLLQVIQPRITQDRVHTIVAQLFPILYTANENAALKISFPPDVFSAFLSHKQRSGRFFMDIETMKYKLARHYSCVEPTHSLSVYPKIAFERLAEPSGNAVCMDSSDKIWCIARSADGSRVVSGDGNGTLEIWDGWTGERVGKPIMAHREYVIDVNFSPDGTKFVSGSFDMTVKIWDTHTRRLVWQLKSESNVGPVEFSPDGSRVVSGHWDGRIRIWDAQNGNLIAESQGRPEAVVFSVAYSPDGRRIISGSEDKTVRIWDAESAAAVGRPLKGHESIVRAVAYSPDGSKIVSGSDEGTICIWDAKNGMPVGKPLKSHMWSIIDLGFSQDGNTIICASSDETFLFWNVADGAHIGDLCRGESRWDPVHQNFVSLPSWWPKLLLRIQALVYSANPLYIPDDEWIRTLDGDLFLRIPLNHRACSCHAASESTTTTNPDDERLMTSAWRGISQSWVSAKAMGVEKPDL